MRKPSTPSQLLGWHRDAIAGRNPPIHDGEPQAGWYRTRLVKGGPWVGVRIFVEREICPDTGDLISDEVLVALVDGGRRDPSRLWTYLTPISREEYLALEDRRRDVPAMAATLAPIDISRKAVTP